MSGSEMITRRRKWSASEQAALLAKVEAEGGKVALVARRHGLSESLLYNCRSARKAASAAPGGLADTGFVRVGVVGSAVAEGPAMLRPLESGNSRAHDGSATRVGVIEIALPTGARICIDASVNEAALTGCCGRHDQPRPENQGVSGLLQEPLANRSIL